VLWGGVRGSNPGKCLKFSNDDSYGIVRFGSLMTIELGHLPSTCCEIMYNNACFVCQSRVTNPRIIDERSLRMKHCDRRLVGGILVELWNKKTQKSTRSFLRTSTISSGSGQCFYHAADTGGSHLVLSAGVNVKYGWSTPVHDKVQHVVLASPLTSRRQNPLRSYLCRWQGEQNYSLCQCISALPDGLSVLGLYVSLLWGFPSF